MKTLLAVCIAALGLSAASTQSLKVTLAVPVFVSGVELNPGTYTVEETENGANVVLRLHSAAGDSVNFLVNRVESTPDSKAGVLFNLQNGRYNLNQVWLNADQGFQILQRGE